MSNVDLLHRHLGSFGKPVEGQDLDAYADDVVIEFPYAPEGHTRKLEGKAAVSRFFANIPNFSDGFAVGEPRVIEAGDVVVAEYPGSSTFKESGLPYSQEYIAIFTIADGKIAHVKEYYDGLRVLRALGEIE